MEGSRGTLFSHCRAAPRDRKGLSSPGTLLLMWERLPAQGCVLCIPGGIANHLCQEKSVVIGESLLGETEGPQ